MERIVIEVDGETAKRWRSATRENKLQISRIINVRLAKELMRDKKENLIKAMDKIARTAKENGLTEEILQEILTEDD